MPFTSVRLTSMAEAFNTDERWVSPQLWVAAVQRLPVVGVLGVMAACVCLWDLPEGDAVGQQLPDL